MDKGRVTVEVVGPTSKPPVTLSWHGTTAHGDFTPVEPGPHQVRGGRRGGVGRDGAGEAPTHSSREICGVGVWDGKAGRGGVGRVGRSEVGCIEQGDLGATARGDSR